MYIKVASISWQGWNIEALFLRPRHMIVIGNHCCNKYVRNHNDNDSNTLSVATTPTATTTTATISTAKSATTTKSATKSKWTSEQLDIIEQYIKSNPNMSAKTLSFKLENEKEIIISASHLGKLRAQYYE
jgi:hypothetical protein